MDTGSSSNLGEPSTPSQKATYTPGMVITSDTVLESFRVADLVAMLRERDQPTAGKKADLIARMKHWLETQTGHEGSVGTRSPKGLSPIASVSPRAASPANNLSPRAASPANNLSTRAASPANNLSPRAASPANNLSPRAASPANNLSPRAASPANNLSPRATSQASPSRQSPSRSPRTVPSESPKMMHTSPIAQEASAPVLPFIARSPEPTHVQSTPVPSSSQAGSPKPPSASGSTKVNVHMQVEDVEMSGSPSREKKRGHGWDRVSEAGATSPKDTKKQRSLEPEVDRKVHVRVSTLVLSVVSPSGFED
jgi:hypothetical protein